ncbi:MAG: hypothetical protein AAF714_05565 [Pseudomonadota bacterium]
MRRRKTSEDAAVGFSAHREYLFHITCRECGFYWTYASMESGFDIEKRGYSCPNCGHKGRIELQDEVTATSADKATGQV